MELKYLLIMVLTTVWKDMSTINPIPAGVLENQDMLGGGQFDPPVNPMFYVQI